MLFGSGCRTTDLDRCSCHKSCYHFNSLYCCYLQSRLNVYCVGWLVNIIVFPGELHSGSRRTLSDVVVRLPCSYPVVDRTFYE